LISEITGVDSVYEIPDVLWERIVPLLPPPRKKKKVGRPRMDYWKAMNAILYILRTGCQWNALPRSLGASTTVFDRYQEWQQAGVFRRMWVGGLLEYDIKKGIDWEWQAMDGVMTKAPLGEKSTGPNPTDRAKSGTKRSLLVEGNGVPIAVTVDGANRHGMKLAGPTLESMVIDRPEPAEESPQKCVWTRHTIFQKYVICSKSTATPRIFVRGEETSNKKKIPGYRAGRWVVERTHSWMNRFRRLLMRWEKKEKNYIAMLHFACAWITYRAGELFE
jgi:putative transposase